MPLSKVQIPQSAFKIRKAAGMHFRAITRIVGLLVILFSGTMFIPGLVALFYRDGACLLYTSQMCIRDRFFSLVSKPQAQK